MTTETTPLPPRPIDNPDDPDRTEMHGALVTVRLTEDDLIRFVQERIGLRTASRIHVPNMPTDLRVVYELWAW